MNKIKYFMLAMMAFVASASFTACSSDDDNKNNGNQSNYDRRSPLVAVTMTTRTMVISQITIVISRL